MIDYIPLIDRIYEMLKEYNNEKYIKHSTQSNWQADEKVQEILSEALREF